MPVNSPPAPVIVCDPNTGEIFVPAIAALAFMSSLTIDPFTICAEVTVLLLGVPILTEHQ